MRLTTNLFIGVIGISILGGDVLAGELNPPPGPVESTQATLLNSQWTTLPYTITEPGVYRLTSDLVGVEGQNGIIIASSDVTIDLNGFTLRGVPGSGSGILPGPNSFNNVTVQNGRIVDWGGDGFDYGIFIAGEIRRCVIRNVTVTGCGLSGIQTGLESLIENCIVEDCGGIGIYLYGGVVRNSISTNNGLQGISTSNDGGVIENCRAHNNGGAGILAYDGTTIKNCSATDNGGAGIRLGSLGHVVQGCVVNSNDGGGIQNAAGSTITGCSIDRNTGFGVSIYREVRLHGNTITRTEGHGIVPANLAGAPLRNYITDNLITSSVGWGINLPDGQDNFIYRNAFKNNSSGAINSPNSDAPMAPSSATARSWDNIGS